MRGGGSAEDLACFNDVALVRKMAECSYPLISAIGHETDTTLIDYVSDLRAPTPTAAAELSTPDKKDLLSNIEEYQLTLNTSLNSFLENCKIEKYQKISELQGNVFEGTICTHPFLNLGYNHDIPMLDARFVTTEQGTGIVHCAPSHGPDDFNLCLKNNIKAEETDKLKDFGYKTNKTGLAIGTSFEYLKDFNLGLTASSFVEKMAKERMNSSVSSDSLLSSSQGHTDNENNEHDNA